MRSRASDIYSPAKRSEIMARVRGKDTALELTVRRMVHRMGFRFRLHAPDLPGRPDVVLPRHRKVIFVNGCFWHQHNGCPKRRLPQVRRDWWATKLRGNALRDRRNLFVLRRLGWSVLVIWQCELRESSRVEATIRGFLTSQGLADASR